MSEAADLVKRLRAIAENDWRISFLAHTSDTANEAADLIVSQEVEIAKLREALQWYAEQTAGCRKITSEGNEARHALDADGGKRARLALLENTDDKG